MSRTDASPASLPAAKPFDPSAAHNFAKSLITACTTSHAFWLGAILLVGLVLRIAWVSSVQPDPRDGRFDDMVGYMEWASEGFNHKFTVRGDEVVITG